MLATLLSLAVSLAAALLATLIHFEVLHRLSRRLRQHSERPRKAIVLTILAMLAAHFVEIALHAGMFAVSISVLGLGDFAGMEHATASGLFYLAAETYSSLGYGDIIPSGGLRIIAATTSLNGIILLAWSGSFMFTLAQHFHRARSDGKEQESAGSPS